MAQAYYPPRTTFGAIVVVGWSIASSFAALVAWALVTLAAQLAVGMRGELVEGMPVFSMWFLSAGFALVGVAGGGVCLGLSSRVHDSRGGRAAAYVVSALALACSIAALVAGFLVFTL
ncbi:hypothetical protein [Microbacterium sp. MYb62]|uniref:hypothetical protein n=1 Tax=Microbacterium sp. MYb62 TaxID=1848690 RepID=UPI000CFB1641|nr:hypothetical protein [Microbacterium sp. MYb62]PRB16472.1 hypothetical protein CQ042_06335 [Microbacterium sp. MYb62]